jgi:hypothetical protein
MVMYSNIHDESHVDPYDFFHIYGQRLKKLTNNNPKSLTWDREYVQEQS